MVNPNRFYTYAYLREDRTPYYIGKGQTRRAYQQNGKSCAVPKDKSRIIFLKYNLTEEDAFKHEIYMIAVFGRKDLGTGILHNRTDGGDGPSGVVRSQQTKDKLRKVNIGKTLSQETKDKIGKSLSGENSPNYGKIFSEETRNKISKSKLGENHPKSNWWKITFSDNRTIIRCGLTNWAKQNGYNYSPIHNVYTGKRKRHKDIVAVEKLAQPPTTQENFDV
jgi:hypothetical protein